MICLRAGFARIKLASDLWALTAFASSVCVLVACYILSTPHIRDSSKGLKRDVFNGVRNPSFLSFLSGNLEGVAALTFQWEIFGNHSGSNFVPSEQNGLIFDIAGAICASTL
jgi:hypothetical protein